MEEAKGHHKVPQSLWKKYGFSDEAQDIWDAESSRIPTPNGHNMTAHGKKTGYISQVEQELQNSLQKYIKDNKITGSLSAKQEREFAEQFVEHIDNTDNKFIRGFNNAVPGGPEKVKRWHQAYGKHYEKAKPMKVKAFLGAGEDLKILKGKGIKGGRRIPYVKYAFTGTVVSMTFTAARADGAGKVQAGAEAAYEVVNPMPLSLREGWDLGESIGEGVGTIYGVWENPNQRIFGSPPGTVPNEMISEVYRDL